MNDRRQRYKAPIARSTIGARIKGAVGILPHHAERIGGIHGDPAAVATWLLVPGRLARVAYGAVVLATGNQHGIRIRALGKVIDLGNVKSARSGNERAIAGRRGGLKRTSIS